MRERRHLVDVGAPLRTLLAVSLGALAGGRITWLTDRRSVAEILWAAGAVAALGPALWWVISALRHVRLGVDVIAVLSLVGTLAVGEYLAGALISVMLATGRALESAAERRAAKDLHSLLQRVPRRARRRTPGGVEAMPLDELDVGEAVIIGPGELVPVDGHLLSDWAVFDESVLTGESVHTEHRAGEAVSSGAVNAGGTVEITANVSRWATTPYRPTRRGRRRLRFPARPSTVPSWRGSVWTVSRLAQSF